MKKCQSCAEEIQDEVKVCKHCGKKQKKGLSRKEGIIATIAILFMFTILVSISGSSNPSIPAKTNSEQKVTAAEAYVISQNYVEKILKSPSTADFPLLDYKYSELGNNKYKIAGYVDAQNSFGAKIRSDYFAILSYNNGGWSDMNNWTLHQLIFDGELVYSETPSEE